MSHLGNLYTHTNTYTHTHIAATFSRCDTLGACETRMKRVGECVGLLGRTTVKFNLAQTNRRPTDTKAEPLLFPRPPSPLALVCRPLTRNWTQNELLNSY